MKSFIVSFVSVVLFALLVLAVDTWHWVSSFAVTTALVSSVLALFLNLLASKGIRGMAVRLKEWELLLGIDKDRP